MSQCMTDGTTTITVIAHAITRNFWEYYITDKKITDKIVECLVYGDFLEYGDVDIGEISPYIISITARLEGLAPAPGWRWVSQEESSDAPVYRESYSE